jgi:hypothetical protein
MIRVTFDKDHSYELGSSTDFLAYYAMLNHAALEPPLVNVFGARNLLALRAHADGYGRLNLDLSDDAFVDAAAQLGMFTVERFDGMAK